MKLVLALLVFLFAQLSYADTVWTENWDQNWQDRWTNIGYAYDCSYVLDNVLIQNCQSAALVSDQKFSITEQITFTGSIYTEPGSNSTTTFNLAHHTLFGADDGPNGQYCGIYLYYDIENQTDHITVISYPDIQYIGALDHQVHIATVIWVPEAVENGVTHGQCQYHIDDHHIFTSYYSFTVTQLALWKGTNSVDPGSGNDGSVSHAEHGPITVITTNP